jgi:(p)ppGpp synthase/HD superfamily hydrolase
MSKEETLPDFVRALAFASWKHSQQRRKDADASPYINHPIALVSILAVEAGISDRETLCAALLHDMIEIQRRQLKSWSSCLVVRFVRSCRP